MIQDNFKEVIMKIKSKNINGSTLVECIAALAIFSIASFILLSGFSSAANLVVESGRVKDNSNKIVEVIETSQSQSGVTVDETMPQNFTFTLGSSSYSITGSYKTVTCDGMSLTQFIPNIENNTNDLIPGTTVPVNGEWPSDEEFDNSYYIYMTKGTTFKYGSNYYIVVNNTYVFNYVYYYVGDIVKILDTDAFVWTGETLTEFRNFYIDNLVSVGDKILYDGKYYCLNEDLSYNHLFTFLIYPPDNDIFGVWTIIQ